MVGSMRLPEGRPMVSMCGSIERRTLTTRACGAGQKNPAGGIAGRLANRGGGEFFLDEETGRFLNAGQ
jgi:hypothetical protein